MDVKSFMETWKTATIALQDSEKGRLIDALASSFHNSDADIPSTLCGREKAVFPYLKEIVSKTTNERTA